jgi:hypothetical protein
MVLSQFGSSGGGGHRNKRLYLYSIEWANCTFAGWSLFWGNESNLLVLYIFSAQEYRI